MGYNKEEPILHRIGGRIDSGDILTAQKIVNQGDFLEVKIDEIIRSGRKTISLEVTPDARLIIRAPHRVPMSVIRQAAASKAAWIAAKQQLAAVRLQMYPPRQYADGESFLYLGRSYRLAYMAGLINPEIRQDMLCVPDPKGEDQKQRLIKWYRAQALDVIRARVEYYSRLTGLAFQTIGITGAKKRWGSCGPNNTLNFTWRLVMAPMDVIDCVVVHELAHTRFHDHSHSFWAKVYAIMPDYEKRRKWLDDNSGLLVCD